MSASRGKYEKQAYTIWAMAAIVLVAIVFIFLFDNKQQTADTTETKNNVMIMQKEKASHTQLPMYDLLPLLLASETIQTFQETESDLFQKQYANYHSYARLTETQQVALTSNILSQVNLDTLVEQLKKADVHAVFFMTTESVSQNASLVRRLLENGHEIGQYVQFFDDKATSIDEQVAVLKAFYDMMQTDYQYVPKYVRYSQGRFNEQSLRLVDQLGLTSVFWTEKAQLRLQNQAIYSIDSVQETALQQFIAEAKQLNYHLTTSLK